MNAGKLALEGRVVTMDAQDTVHPAAVVYIDDGIIVDIRATSQPAPTAFASVPLMKTGGTIYPGLIELHNHLSYNVLPLWETDKTWNNRGQWINDEDYDRMVRAPMRALGAAPGYPPSIVRYVEAKCLLAGVTTSQGMKLYYASNISRYYKGIVRNVEQTQLDVLPEASTRIGDVSASSWEKFDEDLDELEDDGRIQLLHLAEGVGDSARKHFLALKDPTSSEWAINEALVGIHSTALREDDFERMGDAGAAIVWSPLSNLLLYGDTTDVATAREKGVKIGLGSDWSPSGSRNLLAELKVARVVSSWKNAGFTDLDLVAMVTRDAAEILGWEASLGSLESGKLADLMVVAGRKSKGPYEQLLEARESSVSLVVIGGVPRCGRKSLMAKAGITDGEIIKIGGCTRVLNLEDEWADEIAAGLTLGEARIRLEAGMASLRDLPSLMPVVGGASPTDFWALELDHEDLDHEHLRHHLPDAQGTPTGGPITAGPVVGGAAPAEPPESLPLDPLTVSGEKGYWTRLSTASNLPQDVAEALRALK